MNAFGMLYVAVLVAFRRWGKRWRPRTLRRPAGPARVCEPRQV